MGVDRFYRGHFGRARMCAADDTKATTKPGVDAKTAFARIKTLAGSWKSQTTMKSMAEHAKAKGADHNGEDSVNYKLTGAGTLWSRHSFRVKATKWYRFTTWTVTICG